MDFPAKERLRALRRARVKLPETERQRSEDARAQQQRRYRVRKTMHGLFATVAGHARKDLEVMQVGETLAIVRVTPEGWELVASVAGGQGMDLVKIYRDTGVRLSATSPETPSYSS